MTGPRPAGGLLLVHLTAGPDRHCGAWLPAAPDGCVPVPARAAAGDYRARVVLVRQGATVTAALVDRLPGTYLLGTGSARFGGTGRLNIPVTLREPTELDPPVLTDVPLRWLAPA